MTELAKRHPMSNAELNARKRVGSRLTQAGSVLGLGSVVALGAAHGAPGLARTGKIKRLTVPKAEAFRDRTKNSLIATGAIGGGISGVNGLNNAAVTREELRRKNALKPVKKNLDPSPFEDGFYGVDSDEIAKAFEMPKLPKMPQMPNLAQAGQALQRTGKLVSVGAQRGFADSGKVSSIKSPAYKTGFGAGTAARGAVNAGQKVGAAAAAHPTITATGAGMAGGGMVSAFNQRNKNQFGKAWQPSQDDKKRAVDVGTGGLAVATVRAGNRALKDAGKIKSVTGRSAVPLRSGGRFTALAGGTAAGVAVGNKMRRKKGPDQPWTAYVGKSATSAFGISHD